MPSPSHLSGQRYARKRANSVWVSSEVQLHDQKRSKSSFNSRISALDLEDKPFPSLDENSDASGAEYSRDRGAIFSSEYFYNPHQNETREDGELVVIGETIREENEINEDGDGGSDRGSHTESLPVRILTNFTCFVIETSASGFVSAQADDDQTDEDLDAYMDGGENEGIDSDLQMIQLSTIDDLWFDPEHPDPRYWVRTQHAWYILDRPSAQYLSFFKFDCIPHLFVHIIVSMRHEEEASFDDLASSLECKPGNSPEAAQYALYAFGEPLSKNDFNSVKAEIVERLETTRDGSKSFFMPSPLMRSILPSRITMTFDNEKYAPSDDASDSTYVARKEKRKVQPVDTEKETTSKAWNPVVTPKIYKIAQPLFREKLRMARDSEDNEETTRRVSETPFIVHHGQPQSIIWGKALSGRSGFYRTVLLDGVEYHIGDTVAVRRGRDSNTARALNAETESAKTTNVLAQKAWFSEIKYFCDKKNPETGKLEKVFHGRWFQHGSNTVLAETAHPLGLFLMNACDVNTVSSIVQKCRVEYLAPGVSEPNLMPEQDAHSCHYFLSHVWDEAQMRFIEPTEDPTLTTRYCEDHKSCYSCAMKQHLEDTRSTTKTPYSLAVRGQTYHLYDFVYIQKGDEGLLSIAQITDLMLSSSASDIEVWTFIRYEEQRAEISVGNISQMRRIRPKQKQQVISAEMLDGRCHVEVESTINDLNVWTSLGDTFYIGTDDERGEILRCNACVESRQKYIKKENLVKSKHYFRALDLFSGAGGLSSGMEFSGYVKTYWAVEFSPSAALTFKKNHPDVIVYNQDSNSLLEHALEGGAKALYSLGPDKRPLPPLPGRDEVDLIMGGPPCQPYSGANTFKKATDKRPTLVANMLAYVEYYRPLYFLLENVTGLLNYSLLGEQDGRRIVGGIEAGILKLIMRSLISLGYQVQVKVLNAADHGSPQNRNRVIFWAARIISGLHVPIPQFPVPKYIPKRVTRHSTQRRVTTIGDIPLATRSLDPDDQERHQCAPYWAVTVEDAIHDLPGYEWTSSALQKGSRDGSRAPEEVYPVFTADKPGTIVGFEEPCRYLHGPRHPYQGWSRRGLSTNCRVSDQLTTNYSTDVVLKTINVPLKANADYRDLPFEFRRVRPQSGSKPRDSESIGAYGRLDAKGQFRTAMTNVRPNSKGSRVLHPTQRRAITVRECARAQGFPDCYTFLSVNEKNTSVVRDQFRQIGNAVPVPLAFALGNALGETLVAHWRDNDD